LAVADAELDLQRRALLFHSFQGRFAAHGVLRNLPLLHTGVRRHRLARARLRLLSKLQGARSRCHSPLALHTALRLLPWGQTLLRRPRRPRQARPAPHALPGQPAPAAGLLDAAASLAHSPLKVCVGVLGAARCTDRRERQGWGWPPPSLCGSRRMTGSRGTHPPLAGWASRRGARQARDW